MVQLCYLRLYFRQRKCFLSSVATDDKDEPMDCKWKKLGQLFQVLRYVKPAKIAKVVSAPW